MSHSSCAWKAAQAPPRFLARRCFLLPLIPLTSQNPNKALGGATHPSCPFTQKPVPAVSETRFPRGKSLPASFPHMNPLPNKSPTLLCCRDTVLQERCSASSQQLPTCTIPLWDNGTGIVNSSVQKQLKRAPGFPFAPLESSTAERQRLARHGKI